MKYRKIYSNEPITNVAIWNNGLYSNDFKYCLESLYITNEGDWFIYGEGGPLSKYSVKVGNSYISGMHIKPISEDDAYIWLETHGNIKDWKEYFPDRIK